MTLQEERDRLAKHVHNMAMSIQMKEYGSEMAKRHLFSEYAPFMQELNDLKAMYFRGFDACYALLLAKSPSFHEECDRLAQKARVFLKETK